jgi:hypothetical protein
VIVRLDRVSDALRRKDRRAVSALAADPCPIVAQAALDAADEISGIHPRFHDPVEL